jgi:uncharacterized protein
MTCNMQVLGHVTFALLCIRPAHAENAILATPAFTSRIATQSWKTLRDKQTVKHGKDYSCGAASLATILREHYGMQVTEHDMLAPLNDSRMRMSFEDMQNILPNFSYRGIGYAATFSQLMKIRIPVIVYLKSENSEHFSVVRGIDENTVWLADPSLGNRTYSKAQFLKLWETQGGVVSRGKFFAVLPEYSNTEIVSGFFTNSPTRQASGAVRQLAIRPF